MHTVNGQQKKPKKKMDTTERLGKSLFDGQQAFSQVGVQESYGRPLFREN